MARPRPPYLQQERSRHGRTVWYVRIGAGPRTRIPGDYGSPEFTAAYKAAVAGHTGSPRQRNSGPQGTLAWLVALYMQSADWAALGPVTRKDRSNILKRIVETGGRAALADIDRATIVEGRERRKDTPAAARHFVDTMRGLFRWAAEAGHVARDPTEGVRTPKTRTAGYKSWTMDDVAQYRARWPEGTVQRQWLEVLLATGLRRGDAVRLGPDHVKAGVATIATEKSGRRLEVYFTVAPGIAAIGNGRTYITGLSGVSLTKESFGNLFRDACNAAAIGKSAHGIRKLAASLDAERGATEAQLMAKYGWTDPRMAAHYTRAANRRKLALEIGR